MKKKSLLSLKETSALLNVHPNTLKRWDSIGYLKSVRLGIRGDRKYKESEVRKLITESQKQNTVSSSILVEFSAIISKEQQILLKKVNDKNKSIQFELFSFPLIFRQSIGNSAINQIKRYLLIEVSDPKIFCMTNTVSRINHLISIGVEVTFRSKIQNGSKIEEEIPGAEWVNKDQMSVFLSEKDKKIIRCYKTGRFFID